MITKTVGLTKLALLSVFALLLFASPRAANADTVFSDGTFNLGNYSAPITYNSNPGNPTIAVSQATTGGNPGDALLFTYDFSADPGATISTATGLINSSWNYDPSTQGAIAGINFSVDKELNTIFPISSISAPALLEQGGQYYIDFLSGDTTGGVYQTISGTDLQAADFGLYDFATGTYNTAINPNFTSTGGEISFGIANRQNISDPLGSSEVTVYDDNLTWDIVSTPEPGSLLLLGIGLLAVALASKGFQRA